MSEIASAVNDLPVSISRTGLYIYFHAALCARPLTNDLTLLNYLHSKYQGDTQSLVVDLIVASFDTLANALHRNRTPQSLLCYRSFVANKLPLLLTALTPSLFPHSSVQLCIQTALSRIDVHPFPPLSSQNDGVNEVLRLSRREFLQACIMHQLGSDSAFASLTSDSGVINVPRRIRYTEENLAAQCVANVHRVDQLVHELETMSGNAGAISGALVQVGMCVPNTGVLLTIHLDIAALLRYEGNDVFENLVQRHIPQAVPTRYHSSVHSTDRLIETAMQNFKRMVA